MGGGDGAGVAVRGAVWDAGVPGRDDAVFAAGGEAAAGDEGGGGGCGGGGGGRVPVGSVRAAGREAARGGVGADGALGWLEAVFGLPGG